MKIARNRILKLGHLKCVNLRKGDVLVLTYEGNLSHIMAERLRNELTLVFPGHKALVLGSGLELGAVRSGTKE